MGWDIHQDFASSRELESRGHAKVRREGLLDEIIGEKLSREGAKGDSSMNVEEVSSVVVDTAFHHHRDLGPGLHQTGTEQTSGLRVFA